MKALAITYLLCHYTSVMLGFQRRTQSVRYFQKPRRNINENIIPHFLVFICFSPIDQKGIT